MFLCIVKEFGIRILITSECYFFSAARLSFNCRLCTFCSYCSRLFSLFILVFFPTAILIRGNKYLKTNCRHALDWSLLWPPARHETIYLG